MFANWVSQNKSDAFLVWKNMYVVGNPRSSLTVMAPTQNITQRLETMWDLLSSRSPVSIPGLKIGCFLCSGKRALICMACIVTHFLPDSGRYLRKVVPSENVQ